MTVEVRRLGHSYGDAVILERINLTVAESEFVTIVGPSGCGKSTFLRMLLSQEKPSRGEILIDGAPIPDEPGPDRGVVFQRYSVFPHLTVAENLILRLEFAESPFFARLWGAARRKALEVVDEMLECVELTAARDAYPMELSGGMQQRLAIAQALIRRPEILLLDEPFGALDPGTRANMHRLMLDLWRDFKMTVFMVTHDIEEGFKLGTRLLVFDKVRWDPQAPQAFGATITYDLPLTEHEEARRAPLPGIGPPDEEQLAENTMYVLGGQTHDR